MPVRFLVCGCCALFVRGVLAIASFVMLRLRSCATIGKIAIVAIVVLTWEGSREPWGTRPIESPDRNQIRMSTANDAPPSINVG